MITIVNRLLFFMVAASVDAYAVFFPQRLVLLSVSSFADNQTCYALH